ncbi:hypothetical protein AVEN_14148-1 [Araneus ventricosus]|uniref:Uncharacterized protein n=1 Tax=Araneus ventricosus TaxID=182803 RepID=A0A4Y2FZ36_ARAVE|nr:hypothetical protein AVEN_14148-1 [Araneus ventricosus]
MYAYNLTPSPVLQDSNDGEISSSYLVCPSSVPDAISQAGEKMFLGIYKALLMNIIRLTVDMQHFSNHQPRSKLIFPQFLQPKERRSNKRLAIYFCFGTFNGTCTKGTPLEEEEEFELDKNGLCLFLCSHGRSLPSNTGLMVGKRVLQGEAWSDLSDSRGTHDLGDKLGDHFGDLGDK